MPQTKAKKEQAPPGKKLLRSRDDCYIAGICGGLGAYFEIDSLIFRLLFILLALFGGSGIVGYIIFWILVPQEGESRDTGETQENIRAGAEKTAREIREKVKSLKEGDYSGKQRKVIGGLIIMAVGFIFLIQNFFPTWGLTLARLWPLILVAAGIGIIIGPARKE